MHLGKGKFCDFCGKMFSQVKNLRDHEKDHIKKKHVKTEDPEVRKKQELTLIKQGRPSILNMDRKKKEEESKKSEESPSKRRKTTRTAK